MIMTDCQLVLDILCSKIMCSRYLKYILFIIYVYNNKSVSSLKLKPSNHAYVTPLIF